MIEAWVYVRYAVMARSRPSWNGDWQPIPFATRWSDRY
jgi:hypothetical protein